MFDKIFAFQNKFTKLIVSNIPSSLLSRFWESDSDVKLVILDEASTGSWCSDELKIVVSLIVSASIDEVSPASTTKIKNKQRDRK